MSHIENLPPDYQRIYASLKRGQSLGNLDTSDWSLLREFATYDDDPEKPGDFARLARYFDAWKSSV